MIRKLLTIALALSLSLCVGSAVVWVRSYFYADRMAQQWASTSAPDDFKDLMMWIASFRGSWVLKAEFVHARVPLFQPPSVDSSMALRDRWASLRRAQLQRAQMLAEYQQIRSAVLTDNDQLNGGRFWLAAPIVDTNSLPIRPSPWILQHKSVESPVLNLSTVDVGAPIWCPTLAFAVSTLLLWLLRRRLRPFEPHRCRRCGYDLRATSDRCPECGTRSLGSASGPEIGAPFQCPPGPLGQ